jgi:glutamate synthase domain-containing protein 2/CDGSH-type Zn-finger protein
MIRPVKLPRNDIGQTGAAMSEPRIAAREPIAVRLEEGEDYYWCKCGRSKSQPFCDGSHAGTDFAPVAFTAKESGEAWLCRCKRTGNAPYCDGTHATLDSAGDQESAGKGADDAGIGVEPTPEEPTLKRIHDLARHGLERLGPEGEMVAMGVPRVQLPQWDDIQIVTAQLATRPLAADTEVGTDLVIGPNADKPLKLGIPLFVSDMSFGALSEEAKIALARGAELAGTGICSGEGGMLPEEQAENTRYLYELASAMFGYDEALLEKVQAFHFKGGQAAKTGTGGHLPGRKVTERIAQVRGLQAGQDAVSPSRFANLETVSDFQRFAHRVRELTQGIPIGFKLSANHIEADIDFALQARADYIILDGRGGGTGAAPRIFRDHISVPTIPALVRARRHLDERGRDDITLIITGGLRVPEDFVKALALGADGIALANSAIQAVGCIAARICDTNNCPSGVATQKPELRKRIDVNAGSERLARFLRSSTALMQVMARACGHDHLGKFSRNDLTAWHRDMRELTGLP